MIRAHLPLVFIVPWLIPALVIPQEENREQHRRRKIEAILRVQDSRTPARSLLQQALGDPDPTVRLQAARACASVQDSSLLDLLVRGLTDPSPRVQESSAFAIGQTGRVMTEARRKRLEYDLLWNRLRTTAALPRLLEEIGNFGTPSGLEDMLVKLENESSPPIQSALQKSIARFALRSVYSERSIRFLLRFAKPADRTPWHVVYALQKIGSHPEIVRDFDALLPLRRHPDPLARMHYATLLGKLSPHRDVRDLLARMAEDDRDWRVRVNALRELCHIPGFEPDVVRRSLISPDQHIQATALSGLGEATWLRKDTSFAARALLREISTIAENSSGSHHWLLQGEALVAQAKILGETTRIPSPLPRQPELRAYCLRAAAVTGSPGVMPLIQAEALSRDSKVAVAAIEAAMALCRTNPRDTSLCARTLSLVLDALGRRDVALSATAAPIAVDSLVISADVVPALIASYRQQVASDDLEAMIAILDALGKSRDPRATSLLVELLQSREAAITSAALRALAKINGTDYSSRVRFQAEPVYTNFDFERLWALPDSVPITIETVRGNVGVELYPREAPFTVLNFMALAIDRKLYNGLPWHRVVPNFVVQGGDPRGDGWGGPGYTIRSEFTMLDYDAGIIGMASAGKDTEGSQFFITHSPQPHLDGRYSAFGRVVWGTEVVDRLQAGDTILGVELSRKQ